MSIKRLLSALALAGMVLSVGVTAASAQDPEAPSIVDVAASDGRFQTLVLALEQTGLAAMLADCESGGEYTVLAPTDDAFNAARRGGFNAEEVSDDAEMVANILTYHVIEGATPSEVILTLDGSSVTTANGEDITVAVEGDAISVLSAAVEPANVVVADVQACNGVIHAIDNVLLPPSVASALGIAEDNGDSESGDSDAEAEAADNEEVDAESEELANTGVNAGLVTIFSVAVLGAGVLLSTTARRLRFR
ncbi:MAG: fasciclin domain-containing protein [Acidimicrobiales bacterium]